MEGWCKIAHLAPSKENGYAQVSADGVNKFTTLGNVVLWAGGGTKGSGQSSHLCHHPLCIEWELEHVIGESAEENNARKNCLVWVDYHHCAKKMLVCVHRPFCIKFCPGFASWAEFLANGVCNPP